MRLDSLLLLDGGLVNNLPVDVARAMGADLVIAIDLTQNKHPDFVPKKIKKFMGKGLRWLRQRPDFVNYNRNYKDADLCLNPKLEGYGVPRGDAEICTDVLRRDELQARGHTRHDRTGAKVGQEPPQQARVAEKESHGKMSESKPMPETRGWVTPRP